MDNFTDTITVLGRETTLVPFSSITHPSFPDSSHLGSDRLLVVVVRCPGV